MDNDLRPAIAAMAGGTREPVGWFRYDVVGNSWTWSASLFQLHGFQPGEIVPTTEVFVAHKHPDDREHTDAVLAAVLATGEPFCCRHRIVTSQQSVRTVVTIGQGKLDAAGRVVDVHGYFVDITDAANQAVRAKVGDALATATSNRADIEQAKGALMIVQGVSADDAFAILLWHSSHANVKLRDVARIITIGMTHPLTPAETPTQRISRLLDAVLTDQQQFDGKTGPTGEAAITPG